MLRRSIIAVVVVIITLVGLDAFTCVAVQEDKIKIAVTIDILKPIVSSIVGEIGEVYSIVPEEAEPHSFTLTPKVIKEALNSDLIVITGHMEWEEKLVERVAEARNIQPEFISINLLNLSGIKILEIEGERNIHGFWLLPDNAVIIARAIKDKILALKPEYSEEISYNYALFEKEVSNLKNFLNRLSSKHGLLGKKVVIGFYAEQYIAEAMGLKAEIALIGEGEIIHPASLSKIYNGFKSGEYACIIVSDTALLMGNIRDALKEISEETGCSIAYVLTVSTSGLERYDAIMYYNAGQVYNALLSEHKANSGGVNIYLLTTITALLIIILETIILVRGRVKS